MARTPLRELVAGHVSDLVAGHSDAAVRGDVEAAEKVEQSGFSGAAGAHEGDEVTLVDVKIEALQDLDFFAAAAVGFVQTADLDQAVGFSSAIDSDHLFRSLVVLLGRFAPGYSGAGPLQTLFSDRDGLAVAKIFRAFDHHGVSDADARDDFGVGAATAAKSYRAALSFVVFHKEDDLFAIFIMHCALGNQDGGGVGARCPFLFGAEESYFDSHIRQNARVKFKE